MAFHWTSIMCSDITTHVLIPMKENLVFVANFVCLFRRQWELEKEEQTSQQLREFFLTVYETDFEIKQGALRLTRLSLLVKEFWWKVLETLNSNSTLEENVPKPILNALLDQKLSWGFSRVFFCWESVQTVEGVHLYLTLRCSTMLYEVFDLIKMLWKEKKRKSFQQSCCTPHTFNANRHFKALIALKLSSCFPSTINYFCSWKFSSQSPSGNTAFNFV